MRDIFKVLLWIAGFILFMLAISFMLNFAGLTSYRFWAPKRENARTEVFRQTDSYVAGKQQMLTRLHTDWTQAEESHKGALCAAARHEASTLDPSQVPSHLSSWECVR